MICVWVKTLLTLIRTEMEHQIFATLSWRKKKEVLNVFIAHADMDFPGWMLVIKAAVSKTRGFKTFVFSAVFIENAQ